MKKATTLLLCLAFMAVGAQNIRLTVGPNWALPDFKAGDTRSFTPGVSVFVRGEIGLSENFTFGPVAFYQYSNQVFEGIAHFENFGGLGMNTTFAKNGWRTGLDAALSFWAGGLPSDLPKLMTMLMGRLP
jgi:hypothetical protein